MKQKILIVLGDQKLSNTLTESLESEGYTVKSLDDGSRAIEEMKSFSPDLLLIDIELSSVNSYDILSEKSLDKDVTKIPVIVISNSGSPVNMRNIPSTPMMKDYIISPHIEPTDVVDKVKKVLSGTTNADGEVKKNTESPSTDSKPAESGPAKKVLWVEDDKLLSTILSKKIETVGFKLLKANNGDEAFKILETEKPDIIMLDIMLPEISGFDILQKIKMQDGIKDVPVIMLSNMSKQGDVEKSKTLGANKFIVKAAVSLDEIIRNIKILLGDK